MTDGPDQGRSDDGTSGADRADDASRAGRGAEPPGPGQWSGGGDQPGGGRQPGYGGPAYGGQPGHGPPPGYGRPGIVELRPLAVDDFLGGALRYVRSHPVATLLPAFVGAVVFASVQLVSQRDLVVEAESTTGFVDAMTGSLPGTLLLVVVAYAVYPPILATLFSLLVPALTGRKLTTGQAWAAARPHLARVYGVHGLLVLIGIVVLGVVFGLLLLLGRAGGAGAVVAVVLVLAAYAGWIYVAVLLTPAVAATVVEGLGVRAALERSRDLVRGAWWRFFGVQTLGGLLLGVASLVVFIPLGIVAGIIAFSAAPDIMVTGTLPPAYFLTIAVGVVLVVTPTIPYVVGLNGLLYADQRIRRERFDVQLAAIAAGHDQGGPAAGTR